MIFDDVNKAYVEFLKKPIEYYCGVNNNTVKRYLFVIFSKLPIVKSLIFTNYAKYLFEQDVLDTLWYAKAELKTLENIKNIQSQNGEENKNINEIIDNVKKYYLVGAYFENKELMEQCGKEYIKKIIKNKHIDSINYTVSRILINYQFPFHFINHIILKRKIMIGYLSSELLFFIHHNLLNVKIINDEYKLYPTKFFKQQLHAYWLSDMLETKMESKIKKATANIARKIINYETGYKKEFKKLVYEIIDYIYSVKFISQINLNKKTKDFIELMKFIVLIECLLQTNKKISIIELKNTHLLSINWLESNYEKLIKNQTHHKKEINQSQNPKNNIIDLHNDFIIRNDAKLKVGIRNFVSNQLVSNDNGNFSYFDSEYVLFNIMDHFKNLEQYGYKVIDGMSFYNKNNEKSRVDFIILDSINEKYYFIKINFSLSQLPLSLCDRLAWVNERFVTEFGEHFFYLKHNINSNFIQNQFKKNNLPNISDKNSHFIVFHNLPFLNFHKKEGVIFYEWKLFKHIFHGSRIKLSEHTQSKIDEKYPKLHETDKMIEQYLKYSQRGKMMKKKFDIYNNAFSFFKINKKQVISKLI